MARVPNIQTPHLSVQSINAAKAEVSRYCSVQIREFCVQFYHAQQASKYLKIGTCPASQNLLAYMGKN